MGEIAPTAIVVVAKAPRIGEVKTRLCPPLNLAQAAALYTGFLLDTVEIALRVEECAVKAVCPSAQDALELKQLLPQAVGYVVQRESGLTAALTQAVEEGLALGHTKVLCISSDNPNLPQLYLEMAIEALDRHELAFGPSEDGGYYLVGSKAPCAYLFEKMVWSTERVLAETVARAKEAGASFELLPPWYDLDTGQELTRFVKELSPDVTEARHTRQALSLLDSPVWRDAGQ